MIQREYAICRFKNLIYTNGSFVVMFSKKLAAASGFILAFCLPFTVFGGYEKELTKGEILDILLQTAPAYTPYIATEDIVSGYSEGEFRADKLADDTEMLVMISRAFPDMEEPAGANAVLKPENADTRPLSMMTLTRWRSCLT